MGKIEEYTDKIKNARYARDVRSAIVGGIKQCYQDSNGGFFKGKVENLSDLPTTNNVVNDTYYVVEKLRKYSWNGTTWEPSSFDESDVQNEIKTLEETVGSISNYLSLTNLIDFTEWFSKGTVDLLTVEYVSKTNVSLYEKEGDHSYIGIFTLKGLQPDTNYFLNFDVTVLGDATIELFNSNGTAPTTKVATIENNKIIKFKTPSNSSCMAFKFTMPYQSAIVVANAVFAKYSEIETEVEDIRVDVNGNIYNSAGDAVRGQIGELKGDLTKAENALTLVKSRNYWNPNEATITTVFGTSLLMSQKITVNEGEKYYLSEHANDSESLVNDPFWAVYQYDADGNRTMSSNWVSPYVVPSDVVSIQFLNASTNYQYIMVEKDTQTKVWEDFFEPYYKCVDDEARENISAISESIEDKTEFVVPSAFYGVVGHETNIYYQNIAKNMSIDSVCGFDTTGLSNVERYRDRLIWKPTSSGTNNGKISFYKNDWNHETKNITVSFKSAPANTGNTEIKVIVIGDSKIAYGEVVRYLDGLFANDSHTLALLGSRYDNQSTGDTRYKHEGRSGWSSYHYAYVNSYNGDTNSFYNENYTDSQYGTKFDFTTYMNNQGYTSVDYVFINLGTNDYGQGISDIKWQTDAMIKSIRAFDANIKIVIGLNEGVYRNDLQHKALNEWIYDLNATKISKYDGKASKVYVLPLYPSIDLVNDYSTTSADMSEGDSVVGNNKKRNKVSDPIHQNRAGFYKYAMCIYSLIKCIEGGLIN